MATKTKTTKPLTKYPLDREKVSQVFLTDNVSTYSYTTNPRLQIEIKSDLNSDVISDITNAIDEVLKFHKL